MLVQRSFHPSRQNRANLIAMVLFFAYVGLVIVPANLYIIPPLLSGRTSAVGFLTLAWNLPLLLPPIYALIRVFKKSNYPLTIPKQERKRFQEKFGISTQKTEEETELNTRKMMRLQWVLMAVIFALVLLVNFFFFQSQEIQERMTAGIVFGGVALWIFLLNSRIMPSYKSIAEDLIQIINRSWRDTKLKLTQEAKVVNRVNFMSKTTLFGKLKGRELEFLSETAYLDTYLRVTLKGHFKKSFILSEKNNQWMKIDGLNIQDCFEKRFEINGVNVGQLPRGFVEKATNYSGNLYLEITPEEMIVEMKNEKLTPFYSMEGTILFLDFLRELVLELEKN